MKFWQNTTYKKGKPGMGKILWAPIDAIDIFPELPSTGLAAGDTVTTTDDFVFKNPNDGFIQLFNDLYKGSELDWKSDGDPSAPFSITTGKGRTNGYTADLIEFYRDVAGVPGVFLVQDDCRHDYWLAVGCECNPAILKFDGKSGAKGGSDAKGFSFEFSAHCHPFLYKGVIPVLSNTHIFLTINGQFITVNNSFITLN